MSEHMNVNIDLSILEVETAGEYHAKADRFLSIHQLLDFIKCPWLYRKKQLGLIPDTDTPALLVDRGLHCRILEGRDAYETAFALGGHINKTTSKPYGKDTNDFRDWCKAQGKPVLSHEQVDLIEQMASGVAMNDEAVDLLLYGRAEGVVRAEYCGTPCHIRIDWTHPHWGIVDLKTCDDLTWFEADAKRYGYPKQMAFYQAVLAQVLGGDMVPVHLVAVEKKEPYRCGVWRVSDGTLAIAQRENEAAIRRLLACRKDDHWPTGYEEIRVLDVA